MSASNELRALVVTASEEEEVEWDFDLMNIQSELMKIDLVKVHGEFSIPLEF